MCLINKFTCLLEKRSKKNFSSKTDVANVLTVGNPLCPAILLAHYRPFVAS